MNRALIQSLMKACLSFVIIISFLLLICFSPSSEASSLYPVEITDQQAGLINDCIGAVFEETNSIRNNIYRYGMVVGAVGECVFSVAYPNGTLDQYYEFLEEWMGSNQVNIPFEHLEPSKYRF